MFCSACVFVCSDDARLSVACASSFLKFTSCPALVSSISFLFAVGLTGTKLACGEGGCGACTVMISRWDTHRKQVINLAANACLVPLCSVHGAV